MLKKSSNPKKNTMLTLKVKKFHLELQATQTSHNIRMKKGRKTT